ncbi:hypothetical protein LOTGIDRAFT_157688 [Lottia gigantea]|uniref:EF-hand domain-containing protein n=1 Tax=Lottia gigantea TaxID=225164 RepID=V4AZE4_LOTGI|nr:hypothetical protein LOTGIDRAFT_157688 [Lottia gigantea]ESP00481.1 hypothetical protein LOTGIDRAFT_157688 [Lottia gigantea]
MGQEGDSRRVRARFRVRVRAGARTGLRTGVIVAHRKYYNCNNCCNTRCRGCCDCTRGYNGKRDVRNADFDAAYNAAAEDDVFTDDEIKSVFGVDVDEFKADYDVNGDGVIEVTEYESVINNPYIRITRNMNVIDQSDDWNTKS